ncbi:hypothetical protein NKH77_21915 [Streptomyces sp. M19]
MRAPAELLARPADDFVADFLGAERELKLLSLSTLADVPQQPAPAIRADEPLDRAAGGPAAGPGTTAAGGWSPRHAANRWAGSTRTRTAGGPRGNGRRRPAAPLRRCATPTRCCPR